MVTLVIIVNLQYGNFEYYMTFFLSNFIPPPPYDGVLMFSANPSSYITFSTNPSPTYTVNRARETVN